MQGEAMFLHLAVFSNEQITSQDLETIPASDCQSLPIGKTTFCYAMNLHEQLVGQSCYEV